MIAKIGSLIFALAALPVAADWKITFRTRVDDRYEWTTTEYYKGKVARRDEIGFYGVNRPVSIVYDYSRNREVTWFPDLHEYIVVRHPAMSADFPKRMPTQETRHIHGHLTQQFVIEFSRSNQYAGVRTNIEAWSASDIQVPRLSRVPVLSPGVPTKPMDDMYPVVTDGLPLMITGDSTWWSGSHSLHSRGTMEVTELIETVLPQSTFEPPAGFKQIVNMPGATPGGPPTQLRARLYQAADWFLDLFGR